MARPTEFGELAERLKQRILEDELQPGALLPSRPSLAREFSVGTQTLQKAVSLLIGEGFLTAFNGGGTFVAEQPPHLTHYGLVFAESAREPGPPSLFYTALEREAEALEAEAGVRFIRYHRIGYDLDRRELERLEADVRARRLAGVILVNAYSPLDFHYRLLWRDSRIPFVSIGATRELVPAIEPDMVSFVDAAIEHLVGLGRRRIAFLDVSLQLHASMESLERLAARRRKVYTPPHWLQRVRPEGIAACLRLLLHPGAAERPDGLVIMDDHATEAATAALADAGVRVPEDLAVVSLGNPRALPPVHAPVHWLGFDSRALLDHCFDLLAAQRQGGKPPLHAWIEAEEVGARKELGVRS